MFLLPGCVEGPGRNPASSHGTLIIIGGGLREDNEIVWSAFADAAGPNARIGVLPTASGLPDAGQSTAADMRPRLPQAHVEVIEIRHDSPERAADPAYAAQMDACDVLWFTGGDQSRITAAFRPPGSTPGDTAAYDAARSVLSRGGLIAGTSAGAAMMSDPMITGGSGEEALLHGARSADDPPGVGIGRGMGFFPYGLTDQHFLRRARLGRLIVALHETGTPRGYGVADNRAILVNLATGSIRTLGDNGLLLVDVVQSTRSQNGITNVRLSLLSDGDRVDGRTGQVQPHAGILANAILTSIEPGTDPFAPDAVRDAMYAAATTAEPVTLTSDDGGVAFTFSTDESTEFLLRNLDPLTLTVLNLRLDIHVDAMTP